MLIEKELELKLNKMINDAAFKAFLTTFKGLIGSDDAFDQVKSISQSFGDKFAEQLAPELASAITDYIKSAQINLSMCATPQALVVAAASAAGPVTGTATGPLVGVIDGKVTPGAIS